jgi:hypothetical protein
MLVIAAVPACDPGVQHSLNRSLIMLRVFSCSTWSFPALRPTTAKRPYLQARSVW